MTAVIYEAECVYRDALVTANRARHEAIAEAQHAYEICTRDWPEQEN